MGLHPNKPGLGLKTYAAFRSRVRLFIEGGNGARLQFWEGFRGLVVDGRLKTSREVLEVLLILIWKVLACSR